MEKSVGHIVAKDIYGPLGEKIDSLSALAAGAAKSSGVDVAKL